MAVQYHITEKESRLIAPLAIRWAIERALGDRDYLRGLVRAYLGSAEAAEDALLERCAASPEYLESFVRKYVATLDQQALIEMLRRTAGESAMAEMLGFNPFDPSRRAAYNSARQFINVPAQKAVLAAGAVALVVICLFPPWKMERWQKQSWSGSCTPPPDKKLEVRFAGFRYLAAPDPISLSDGEPATRDLPSAIGGEVKGFNQYKPITPLPGDKRSQDNVNGAQTYLVYKYYSEMWLLELLGLFVIVVGICAALRDSCSFAERVARIEASREQATGHHSGSAK